MCRGTWSSAFITGVLIFSWFNWVDILCYMVIIITTFFLNFLSTPRYRHRSMSLWGQSLPLFGCIVSVVMCVIETSDRLFSEHVNLTISLMLSCSKYLVGVSKTTVNISKCRNNRRFSPLFPLSDVTESHCKVSLLSQEIPLLST